MTTPTDDGAEVGAEAVPVPSSDDLTTPRVGFGPLAVFALAQFLMVLDQSVMNVSITQLVDEFDTTVSVIQGVITLYALVMATLMITGGKLGDRLGRRRAFAIGLSIYAVGSALTAGSWSVGSLLVGWSILEGIGAALVLPALVALTATIYVGAQRMVAFGVLGGVAGAGIAAGPIIGGWFTTELSWRWVFVGEVLLVLVILACLRLIPREAPAEDRPQVDWVGSSLVVVGLGLIVLGLLQAGTWGWVAPRNSPITPLGFALTPFVVGIGVGALVVFVRWQRHRVTSGRDPLVDLGMFGIGGVRSGLTTMFAMNTILLGVFFTIPLYLQVVLGFDALDTGIRMLPVSVAMFVVSSAGPRLGRSIAPRTIVRVGFVTLAVAIVVMMSSIDVELSGWVFGSSLGLLGVGMGLVSSQLGNVVQTSVDTTHRSEAGGLQFTAQQLGSAVGTALIGTVLMASLATATANLVSQDQRVDDALADQVTVAVADGLNFVPTAEIDAGLRAAGIDDATTTAIVDNYSDAQLLALKSGLLLALVIALAALIPSGRLPDRPLNQTVDSGASRA